MGARAHPVAGAPRSRSAIKGRQSVTMNGCALIDAILIDDASAGRLSISLDRRRVAARLQRRMRTAGSMRQSAR